MVNEGGIEGTGGGGAKETRGNIGIGKVHWGQVRFMGDVWDTWGQVRCIGDTWDTW